MTSRTPGSPDHAPSDDDAGASNPTQLPVEPEFGPELPQPEPEEPGQPAAPI
jgi:hypothetical protein